MKITNDCSLRGMIPEFIFIICVFVLVVMPSLLINKLISLFFIVIYGFISFYSLKYIKKELDFEKYKDNIVKYININKDEFKVFEKNNKVHDFKIQDIKSLNLNIKTCSYGGKYGFHMGFKYIIVTFELNNGYKCYLYTRKAGYFSFFRSMNFIYKLIDYINDKRKFSYQISGHYNSSKISENIDLYLTNGEKHILSKEERKEIKEYIIGIPIIVLVFILICLLITWFSTY